MLLLITGSSDGTSNMLCTRLGDDVFRLNYDLFFDYNISLNVDSWEIESPSGRVIASENAHAVFWWKAFNFYPTQKDGLLVGEMKYICRELYNWGRLNHKLRGNPPDFHNHLGKINILGIAAKFFLVPKTTVVSGNGRLVPKFSGPVVAKSLSSGTTDSKKVLFTTEVKVDQLDLSYPWYLQTKVQSKFDVTVFVCGRRQFAFSRSRENLSGLDWRAEQSFDVNSAEWGRYTLSDRHEKKIADFCSALGVDWGRLDFMEAENDLVFLEYNANGQFLFLDYFNRHRIHDAVAQYLAKV